VYFFIVYVCRDHLCFKKTTVPATSFFIKKRFGNIVISQDLHRKRIVAEDLSNRQDHIFQTRSKKLIRDETLPLFKKKIYLWYSRYKIRANQTPFNYIFLDLGRFVEN
jgi:hypothetical protein